MPQTAQLNIRQKLAAQFLAAGMTVDATAKRVGVDRTTVSKWRRLSTFESHIGTLLANNEKDSQQSLQALKLKAVERLSTIISSKNESVALRAIETVLKLPPATPQPALVATTNAAWDEVRQRLEEIANEGRHDAPQTP
jgi:transposase-like protein